MSAAASPIRSSRFRTEREADWLRLDAMVKRVEARGVRALPFRDAQDLVFLYRQAAASLSVAREISLDAGLVAYLDSLCARAYLVAYAPRISLRAVAARFLAEGAPQAVRRSALPIAAAFAGLGFGVVVAWAATLSDPTWFYAIVPGALAGTRGPRVSTETLRHALYADDPGSLGHLGAFATYLFSHNTQMALLAFALGIIVCVPTMLLALYNGAILGAFFAVHQEKGLGFDVFGWLSIHGVTELSAVSIAVAGGLRLGLAVLSPGGHTRAEALRLSGRDATKLAAVAALMLVVAGLLEGFGRQLVTAPGPRIAVGWGIGLLWLAWFVLGGRARRPAAAEDAP